jgi:archaellin
MFGGVKMKKLLALLAVLGMVNVASAAYTISWVKADGTFLKTGTAATAGTTYEKYYIYYSADGASTDPNALDLKITSTTGVGNIGMSAGGLDSDNNRIYNFYYAPITNGDGDVVGYNRDLIGRSCLAVSGLNFKIGTTVANPDPGTSTYFNASSYNIAFAQKNNFTKIDMDGGNLLATIYLVAGTEADVLIKGASGYVEGGSVNADTTLIGGTFRLTSVPEPMTLSVLALGALGLIRRKLA